MLRTVRSAIALGVVIIAVSAGLMAYRAGTAAPRIERAANRTATLPSSFDRRLGITYVTGPGPGVPQVWLAGRNGVHPRRLGEGIQPLLSPSGRLVAASAVQGPRALHIYSRPGRK
jgi:hypothetical protein